MKTCLDHHKICNAECCRVFYLRLTIIELNKAKKGKILFLKRNLTEDRIWHYKLRGCSYYPGGKLIVPSDTFTIKVIKELNNRKILVAFYKDCKLLDGNLCSGHPENKPEICKKLTWKTAKEIKKHGGRLTPDCMYRGEK